MIKGEYIVDLLENIKGDFNKGEVKFEHVVELVEYTIRQDYHFLHPKQNQALEYLIAFAKMYKDGSDRWHKEYMDLYNNTEDEFEYYVSKEDRKEHTFERKYAGPYSKSDACEIRDKYQRSFEGWNSAHGFNPIVTFKVVKEKK